MCEAEANQRVLAAAREDDTAIIQGVSLPLERRLPALIVAVMAVAAL